LGARGNIDPGNWIQAMLRITDATPQMWAGILIDNRDKILQTASHKRSLLTAFAHRVHQETFLHNEIDELHNYAKDKKSARINQYSLDNMAGYDLKVSAFAGLLSAAIAANVQRVEAGTGQNIALIVNPSCKDGLGPVAVDSENVKKLLALYSAKLPPMINDYIAQFDRTVKMIETGNPTTIRTFVQAVKEKSRLLKTAFSPPPVASALYAPPHSENIQ
jgi:prephenate dehydrogenase